MSRITEFEHNGKKIVKVDLSNIKTNEELTECISSAVELYKGFVPHSVYTIVDITGITFDSESKVIAIDWAGKNEPYDIYCYVIGATGVRKMILGSIIKHSARKNIAILPDETAVLNHIDEL